MPLRSNHEDEVQKEGSTDETNGSDTENRSTRNYICVVCQQPVVANESWRRQGEPVHSECGAELRCGVALESSFDA